MTDELNKLHPDIHIAYKFHYYSTHGVCLPNYYPNIAGDISYQFLYSSLIVIFNATCFFIIASAFAAIYW